MDLVELFKRVTGRPPSRLRPAFIIIGAQKAGTTALFDILAKHPDILAPNLKEPHHFNKDASYAQGMDHYLSHFPARSIRKHQITFEATPAYLFHAEKVAPRIRSDLPQVTCVAILRDPVKRAYSAWNMFHDFKDHPTRSHLYDPRSFRQAVEDEWAGRAPYENYFYLARGHYADQIARFKAQLPEDRLIIRSYLDLKRDTPGFVQRLCRDLGIAPMPADHPVLHIKANLRPYAERLDEDLAKDLYRYFAPEMEKLRDVLGYELDIMEGHG